MNWNDTRWLPRPWWLVVGGGGVDQAGERERRGGTFSRVSWSPVLLLLVVGGVCRLVGFSTFRLFDLLGSRKVGGTGRKGRGRSERAGVMNRNDTAGELEGEDGERSGWRGAVYPGVRPRAQEGGVMNSPRYAVAPLSLGVGGGVGWFTPG